MTLTTNVPRREGLTSLTNVLDGYLGSPSTTPATSTTPTVAPNVTVSSTTTVPRTDRRWLVEVTYPDLTRELLRFDADQEYVQLAYIPRANWGDPNAPLDYTPTGVQRISLRIPRVVGNTNSQRGFSIQTLESPYTIQHSTVTTSPIRPGPIDSTIPDPSIGQINQPSPAPIVIRSAEELAWSLGPNNLGVSGPGPTVSKETLTKLLRENLEVRTKLDLSGTELSVKVQLVLMGNEDEVIAEDEDSVDISGLLE